MSLCKVQGVQRLAACCAKNLVSIVCTTQSSDVFQSMASLLEYLWMFLLLLTQNSISALKKSVFFNVLLIYSYRGLRQVNRSHI